MDRALRAGCFSRRFGTRIHEIGDLEKKLPGSVLGPSTRGSGIEKKKRHRLGTSREFTSDNKLNAHSRHEPGRRWRYTLSNSFDRYMTCATIGKAKQTMTVLVKMHKKRYTVHCKLNAHSSHEPGRRASPVVADDVRRRDVLRVEHGDDVTDHRLSAYASLTVNIYCA